MLFCNRVNDLDAETNYSGQLVGRPTSGVADSN